MEIGRSMNCFIRYIFSMFFFLDIALAEELPNNSVPVAQGSVSNEKAVAEKPKGESDSVNKTLPARQESVSSEKALTDKPKSESNSANKTLPVKQESVFSEKATTDKPKSESNSANKTPPAKQESHPNQKVVTEKPKNPNESVNKTLPVKQESLSNEKTASELANNPNDLRYKYAFRVADFRPTGSRVREMYGHDKLSLQFELAKRQVNHRNRESWANVEWIFMDGKPLQSCGTSDLHIINISIGLKAIRAIIREGVYIYTGIGPNFAIVLLENRMHCCTSCGSVAHEDNESIEHLSNIGIGVIVKTGVQVQLSSNFYIDIFGDYLCLPVFYNHVIDLGGFKFGGSFGRRF